MIRSRRWPVRSAPTRTSAASGPPADDRGDDGRRDVVGVPVPPRGAVPRGRLRVNAPAGEVVPTVGVEEEFFLLRPDGRTAAVAPEVLAALEPGARATAEFSRCQVEIRTGICRTLCAVGQDLSASRRM